MQSSSLNEKLVDKISSEVIYEKFGNFDQSTWSRLSTKSLSLLRLFCLLLVVISYTLVIYNQGGLVPAQFFGSLEFYSFHFALLSLAFAERSATTSSSTVTKRKRALIISEIAISVNTCVVAMYFFVFPMIIGPDYSSIIDVFNSVAIFLSFLAMMLHLGFTKFALLE